MKGLRNSALLRLRTRFYSHLGRFGDRLREQTLREAPKAEALGFEVINWDWHRDDRDTQRKIFHTVAAALSGIRECYPIGFSRFRRSTQRVIVEYLPRRRGEYSSPRQAIVVSRRVVLDEGSWQIALVIIHEATHALLEKKGFSYTEDRRTQIERICRKRDLAFAKWFGTDAEPWIAWIEERLEEEGKTDEELLRDYREQLMAQLERDGIPKLVLRGMRWLHERDMRRRFGGGNPADRQGRQGA